MKITRQLQITRYDLRLFWENLKLAVNPNWFFNLFFFRFFFLQKIIQNRRKTSWKINLDWPRDSSFLKKSQKVSSCFIILNKLFQVIFTRIYFFRKTTLQTVSGFYTIFRCHWRETGFFLVCLLLLFTFNLREVWN